MGFLLSPVCRLVAEQHPKIVLGTTTDSPKLHMPAWWVENQSVTSRWWNKIGVFHKMQSKEVSSYWLVPGLLEEVGAKVLADWNWDLEVHDQLMSLCPLCHLVFFNASEDENDYLWAFRVPTIYCLVLFIHKSFQMCWMNEESFGITKSFVLNSQYKLWLIFFHPSSSPKMHNFEGILSSLK